MTIEKSASSTVHAKATGRSEAHAAKASATDAAAPGGGFGSVLGALADAVDTGTTATTATDTASPATAALPTPFDASLMLQQNPQIAAALATPAAKEPATALADHPSAQTTAVDPTLLVMTPAVDPALAAAMAGQLPAPPAMADVRPKAPQTGADAQAASALTVAANTQSAQSAQPAESLTQTLQHGHGKDGKDPGFALAADAASSVVANAGNEQAAAKGPAPTPDPAASLQLTKALEPILAPLLAKQDKQAERASSKNVEPTYGGTTLGVSSPDFSASAAPTAAMAPDMQVAEQVSYWVSHNVHNAEMKLDGLGASPVEVSIQLQGKEAQISFRSDEAATRAVLESAGTHLKDMLQRDGLVLTGVSVGSSGSGDAGNSSEGRARQGARQTAIAPLQVAAVETGRRLAVPAGRSVDLFV